MPTSLGEGKLWIETTSTLLKNWPYVKSYPWWKSWVNTHTHEYLNKVWGLIRQICCMKKMERKVSHWLTLGFLCFSSHPPCCTPCFPMLHTCMTHITLSLPLESDIQWQAEARWLNDYRCCMFLDTNTTLQAEANIVHSHSSRSYNTDAKRMK